MTRDELVARPDIARGSRSFRLASTLFSARTRERAWLLYAWCRACDDLADGQEMGHGMREVADPEARLAAIRAYHASPDAPCDGCPLFAVCRGGCQIVARRAGSFGPEPECPRVLAHRAARAS